MKKTVILMTALFLMLPNLLCAKTHVVDNAELLSADQVQTLERRINEITSAYANDFDIVIVTEKNIGTATPEAFADDFFDYNGYGLNGVLLLQVTETRDWHISTSGTGPMGGETVFTEYALTNAGNHLVKFLQADDPYGAYNSFIDDTVKYLALAAKGGHYTVLHEWLWLFITIAWVMALLTGFIVTGVWKAGMNTALHNEQAAAYIVPGSLRFAENSDRLLYSTVTKTEKVQQSSSGGGSSHISSSGRSHGGRGGKY
jgi:uncharacterized protein